MRISTLTEQPKPRSGAVHYVGLLLGLALLLGLYAWLRYGGAFGHGDTSAFTWAIRKMIDSGRLVPAEGAYPHGYGYQSLVSYLSALTGLSLGMLQLVGGVLLMFWVVIPAWLAYREFTLSETAAFLATLILLVQPEFLFPLLRGTHEKFVRGLMFLLLYLLLRSLRAHNFRQASGLVAAFYLGAYALITFNNLMATSFMVAIGLALAFLWGVRRFLLRGMAGQAPLPKRLGLVILSLLALAFIFTFYTYPPAQQQLRILQSIADRLALLFLQVEEAASNPYAVVDLGWVSLLVYFLVSLSNWILLACSALVWLWQGWRWFARHERLEQPSLLLWSFYGAFAFQGVLSILVDISGAIAGNLQHRVFPSFTMIAAPVIGGWLVAHRRRLPVAKQGRLDGGVGLVLGVLMLLSVIKATNEPLLSNYWTFYTAAEYRAVSWAEQPLNDRSLWVGFNDRLASGYQISEHGRVLPLYLDRTLPVSIRTRDFLISEVTLMHGERLFAPLPFKIDSFITYDNGETKIYHLRPISPFQR